MECRIFRRHFAGPASPQLMLCGSRSRLNERQLSLMKSAVAKLSTSSPALVGCWSVQMQGCSIVTSGVSSTTPRGSRCRVRAYPCLVVVPCLAGSSQPVLVTRRISLIAKLSPVPLPSKRRSTRSRWLDASTATFVAQLERPRMCKAVSSTFSASERPTSSYSSVCISEPTDRSAGANGQE